MNKKQLLILALLLNVQTSGSTQTSLDPNEPQMPRIEYGDQGLDITSPDGNFHAHAELRAQLRFTEVNHQDTNVGSSQEVDGGQFNVNRVRCKLGGHAYRPWLSYLTKQEVAMK